MGGKTLSILLSVCIALSVLPTAALADEEGVDAPLLEPEENWNDEEWDDSGEEEQPLVIPFPDVSESASYAEAVACLAEMGIFTGNENGNFNPDANITRAETATVICRLMGVEDEAKSSRYQVYDDVPASHWASGYIAKATELGVFNGDGNGRFRPGDPVKYQEMVKILVCACGYEASAQQNGGWPNGYLAVAEDMGFTAGMRFAPTAQAPRHAVAQLVYNSLA